MVENNWYQILELEFYPNPVVDMNVIASAIDKKKNEWTQKATKSTSGKEKAYLEAARKNQIINEMSDENYRAEMISEAKNHLMKELKMVADVGGTVEQEKVLARISKKFPSVREDVIRDELIKLGVKFVNVDERKSILDTYVKKPFLKVTINGKSTDMSATIAGNNAYLQILNCKNFYEFLFRETNQTHPVDLPAEVICKRAIELKEEIAGKDNHDEISSAGSKLTQYCISTAFANEDAKKCYDSYLAWQSRDALFNEIKEMHSKTANGIELSGEAFANYVDRLRNLLPSKDAGKAEDIVKAYCAAKEIPVPYVANIRIVPRCRCGAVLDESRPKCLSCKRDTFVICPKCKAKNLNCNAICDECGADFTQINQGIALCESAESCLERMQFDIAKIQLEQAKKLYPEYPRIKDIASQIEQVEHQIGSIVKDMEQACNQKEYFAARDKMTQIRNILPSYQNHKLEEDINLGIKTAEEQKNFAMRSTDEVAIINACQMAYESCHDCPGIKEIIAKYPPVAATGLQVTCHAEKRINHLTWQPSATKGQVYYVIVRKENAVPNSVTDGELVDRVSTCSVEDTMAEPGKKYFYAVFTERTGITSSPLITQEAVVNYYEIAGVQVTPGNGSLKLTWRTFPPNASIQIERIENDKKIPLTCNNRTVFIEEDLQNDKEYQYRVYLRYTTGLESHDTMGVMVKGIPTCPPKPIDTLIVRAGENGKFCVEWENPENSNLRFFYSEEKPQYKVGESVSVTLLEQCMKPLQLENREDNKGFFTREAEEAFYVTATVIKAGNAVMGNIVRTCSTGNVNIRSISLVNGKIFINVVIPKNSDGFVVLYYHDHFPTDISDVKAKRKLFRREMVEHLNGIEITQVEQKDYYFSVFAVYNQGEDREYSAGTNYLFHNGAKQLITYSLEVRKKFLKKPSLILRFECDEPSFTLPDIDIMYETGRAPVYKENSKLYCQIDEAVVKGNSISYELELDDGLKKGTYMKAFLRDETLAQRYQLKLQRGTNLQIM